MSNTEPMVLRAVENLSRDVQEARTSLSRDMHEVRTRSERLELRVEDLEEALSDRLYRLELEMGTTNAHLDNIARESAITNDLLRKDLEHRLALEKARADGEKEEREQEERRRQDKIAVVKKVASTLWLEIKTPFSTLITAAALWAAYTYFNVPQKEAPAPLEVEEVSPPETMLGVIDGEGTP